MAALSASRNVLLLDFRLVNGGLKPPKYGGTQRRRKVIQTRASFPTDEAVGKLFYLALNNISKKWTMPIRQQQL